MPPKPAIKPPSQGYLGRVKAKMSPRASAETGSKKGNETGVRKDGMDYKAYKEEKAQRLADEKARRSAADAQKFLKEQGCMQRGSNHTGLALGLA